MCGTSPHLYLFINITLSFFIYYFIFLASYTYFQIILDYTDTHTYTHYLPLPFYTHHMPACIFAFSPFGFSFLQLFLWPFLSFLHTHTHHLPDTSTPIVECGKKEDRILHVYVNSFSLVSGGTGHGSLLKYVRPEDLLTLFSFSDRQESFHPAEMRDGRGR